MFLAACSTLMLADAAAHITLDKIESPNETILLQFVVTHVSVPRARLSFQLVIVRRSLMVGGKSTF
jgi:hypothetical protein